MSGLCEHAYLFNNCPYCVIKSLRAQRFSLEGQLLFAQQEARRLREELHQERRRASQMKRALDEGRIHGVRQRQLDECQRSNQTLREKLRLLEEQRKAA